MNLLETYKKRLAISEGVFSKTHGGEAMDNSRKMAVATLLNNTSRFLNEAFTNSVGTQRADLGNWKKFCLNLTTVAVANLIAHELVIVQPMPSISGYITYLRYTAGSNKGATRQGDVFNDPFRLGKVDVNYTGQAITEEFTAEEPALTGAYKPLWTPVVKGQFKDKEGHIKDVKVIKKGELTPYFGTINAEGGVEVEGGLKAGDKVLYFYDNVIIPQNDIPTINVETVTIPLVAKARRIAVYYSQMAAFQAKTDYGFDLGDQLAEKAVGQLSYEIDTEVTNLLIDNADIREELTFNKTVPAGVSKAQHYEGFSELVEIAKQVIYDKTKRFAPNYMLIASNVLPVLRFVNGFKDATPSKINGPYQAGTLNGLKVFVVPSIEPGRFVLGVNGDDMMSSAAVYAPYMAIVPTQLLGYADGAMNQGFSTMYALEMLNKDLLVGGKIVEAPQVIHVSSEA